LPADVRADIVVANILARPLAELAPRLTALVGPGGRIALSGLLAGQRDMVWPHYAPAFELTAREREGWLLIAGRRR
jgi:ribosomal protein L11 methyltransferase